MADAQIHRVRLEGATVSCRIAGEGPLVVLLHGWPQTSHAWRKVIPLLADHATVIAPDLPGFGDSSRPAGGYDKKSVAKLLRDAVRTLGFERLALVGHDVGGLVAYPWAAEWAEEVSHLVLIECGIPGLMDPDVANPLLGGSWHYGFNMLRDLPETLVQGRERQFLQFVLFRDKVGVYQGDAIGEKDIDVYESALRRPGGLRGSFEHYRALPTDAVDNANWVSSPLAVPTLAIGAAEAYGQEWLETVREVAKETELLLIEQSGHYPAEEQPERLATAIAGHLSSNKTAP